VLLLSQLGEKLVAPEEPVTAGSTVEERPFRAA
jgi:hypothetical protein